MNAFILKTPVITEKSMTNAKMRHVYSFYVAKTSSKQQIAEVVEKTFGVNVVMVRTVTLTGKKKRTGRKRMNAQKPDRKKAYVTLKEGQTIALFDVQEKA